MSASAIGADFASRFSSREAAKNAKNAKNAKKKVFWLFRAFA